MEDGMQGILKRREFLELAGLASAGIAGVVFTAGLHPTRAAAASRTREDDFMFLQMSDTHWGFTGPAVNPKTYKEFKKSLREVAESSTTEIATSAQATSTPKAPAVGSPTDDTMRP
jgi:hypothetical protein